MRLELCDLGPGDREKLEKVQGGNGWNVDAALWSAYEAEQTAQRREVVIAWSDRRPVGYGTLLWSSAYEPFRSRSIPEINNLVVAAHARGRGVATALIGHFEKRARASGREAMGIGIGLYADYGPAQRLYVKLGYRPDGGGVTYANRPVQPLETVRLDDELVLWLVKLL